MTGHLVHCLGTTDTSEYKSDRREFAMHLPALHKIYTPHNLLDVYHGIHLTLKTSRKC